ncbi:30S ribosomal protein S6 [bacterium]|nr:30S ribosomal protein S6 [bacterium]
MLKQYETTFIVNVHLEDEQINKTIEKYTKFIEDKGGKVKSVDRWGKHRLAYEIAKKQYGYYVYIRFEAAGSMIRELEREFKLDDSILRYLTILVPKAAIQKEMKQQLKTKKITKETQKNDEPSSESLEALKPSLESEKEFDSNNQSNSQV